MDPTVRHSTLLPATAPYRLDTSLRALAGFAPAAADHREAGAGVRKAFAVPGSGDAVVAEVGPRPDDAPGVALAVYTDRDLTGPEAADIEQAVSRWLGLGDDMTPFLAIAERDRALRPLLADAEGLHQVRFASLGEGVSYFLLTQRTSQAVAAGRKRRIAADLGPRLELDGEEYLGFPTLRALADTPADVLARHAGGEQRASRLVAAVRGVAGLVADRGEDWLYAAPYPEVRDALLGIHGIGPFSARAIMLRVLGRPDELPLEMPQFTELITLVYGPDTPVATVADRYGRYVGWWAYLAKSVLAWRGVASSHTMPRRRTG